MICWQYRRLTVRMKTNYTVRALEGNAAGELDLAGSPIGSLERLRAVRRIRVDAALYVERVEGVHVHSKLDSLGKTKDLVQRDIGVIVGRSKQHCLREWIGT